MPAPVSLDVRRRFQRLIEEEGLSAREAARRLLISAAMGIRLAARISSGRSRRHPRSSLGNSRTASPLGLQL